MYAPPSWQGGLEMQEVRRQNGLVPNGKDTKLHACLSFPTPSVPKADLRDKASQHEAQGNNVSKQSHLTSSALSPSTLHTATKNQEVKNGNINVTAHKHNPLHTAYSSQEPPGVSLTSALSRIH